MQSARLPPGDIKPRMPTLNQHVERLRRLAHVSYTRGEFAEALARMSRSEDHREVELFPVRRWTSQILLRQLVLLVAASAASVNAARVTELY
jgi:hypothetical protein